MGSIRGVFALLFSGSVFACASPLASTPNSAHILDGSTGSYFSGTYLAFSSGNEVYNTRKRITCGNYSYFCPTGWTNHEEIEWPDVCKNKGYESCYGCDV